jgi:hypothetical protein
MATLKYPGGGCDKEVRKARLHQLINLGLKPEPISKGNFPLDCPFG